MDEMYKALREYFGFNSFRPGQEELIRAALNGRDVLGVMPTGSGKSVCYQLPALLKEGVALVVSPLISLMADQVRALLQMGVPAAYLNSSLTEGQMKKALGYAREGKYKIIYVAPERLLVPGFLSFAKACPLSLVAVDEAHCVSQWGQDFRPSYLDIPAFLHELPTRPPLCAFTATATERVRGDIRRLLGLSDPVERVTGFDRPNLFYEVLTPKVKEVELLSLVQAQKGESGIVYCATRRSVEEVCDLLCANGIAASRYHAGLDAKERASAQEDFLFDRCQVMVATNAFGMGIDKSNVRFVIHFNMPKDMESYYQEAGRGGRDGEPCRCTLLYSPKDVQLGRFLIDKSASAEGLDEEARRLKRRGDLERLARMEAYCRETGCLRRFILRYFGEEGPKGGCDNCGNCVLPETRSDIGPDARQILSLIEDSGERYGEALLSSVLRAEHSRRARDLGLMEHPSAGTLARLSPLELRERFDHLLSLGYIARIGEEYPILALTDKGREFLRREGPLYVRLRRAEEAPPTPKKTRPAGPGDPELYEILRELRAQIARIQGVPAFVVFSDATLRDMSARKPRSEEEMLQVSGVGLKKQARYGKRFLQAIEEYLDNQDR